MFNGKFQYEYHPVTILDTESLIMLWTSRSSYDKTDVEGTIQATHSDIDADIDAVKLSSVSVTTLLLLAGEDDLRDVRSAVADLAGRWKDLGISLGIRFSELNNIHFLSPSDGLSEMVALWLKQNYNVRTTLVLCSPHFLILSGKFLQL